MSAPAAKAPAIKESKSGLRRLNPGEILFNDGDKASSLFIIQKGQLRLFKPKGKGFIEIAVLRSGEVIGEMAYFDDDGGGKRSCAASALVSSEIIEISFVAFSKTMAGLNPWFKTIINTLANRLRATNARVRELESNSASIDYGTGKQTGYEFLKPNDLIKILGTLFLVFKSHGEEGSNGISLHRKTIDLYGREIYGIMEAKLETLMQMLADIGLMTIEEDADGMPKMHILHDIDMVRAMFIFYNTEKHLTEDKKLKIPPRTQIFMEAIYSKAKKDENIMKSSMINIVVSDLIENWKGTGTIITLEDLEPAREQGFVGEALSGEGGAVEVEVNIPKFKKRLPIIKFINKVKQINEEKNS